MEIVPDDNIPCWPWLSHQHFDQPSYGFSKNILDSIAVAMKFAKVRKHVKPLQINVLCIPVYVFFAAIHCKISTIVHAMHAPPNVQQHLTQAFTCL